MERYAASGLQGEQMTGRDTPEVQGVCGYAPCSRPVFELGVVVDVIANLSFALDVDKLDGT